MTITFSPGHAVNKSPTNSPASGAVTPTAIFTPASGPASSTCSKLSREQDLLITQIVFEAFYEGLPSTLTHPEHLGNGRGYQFVVSDFCKVHKERTIFELVEYVGGHL